MENIIVKVNILEKDAALNVMDAQRMDVKTKKGFALIIIV
jgi:hypothetical protein